MWPYVITITHKGGWINYLLFTNTRTHS